MYEDPCISVCATERRVRKSCATSGRRLRRAVLRVSCVSANFCAARPNAGAVCGGSSSPACRRCCHSKGVQRGTEANARSRLAVSPTRTASRTPRSRAEGCVFVDVKRPERREDINAWGVSWQRVLLPPAPVVARRLVRHQAHVESRRPAGGRARLGGPHVHPGTPGARQRPPSLGEMTFAGRETVCVNKITLDRLDGAYVDASRMCSTRLALALSLADAGVVHSEAQRACRAGELNARGVLPEVRLCHGEQGTTAAGVDIRPRAPASCVARRRSQVVQVHVQSRRVLAVPAEGSLAGVIRGAQLRVLFPSAS